MKNFSLDVYLVNISGKRPIYVNNKTFILFLDIRGSLPVFRSRTNAVLFLPRNSVACMHCCSEKGFAVQARDSGHSVVVYWRECDVHFRANCKQRSLNTCGACRGWSWGWLVLHSFTLICIFFETLNLVITLKSQPIKVHFSLESLFIFFFKIICTGFRNDEVPKFFRICCMQVHSLTKEINAYYKISLTNPGFTY